VQVHKEVASFYSRHGKSILVTSHCHENAKTDKGGRKDAATRRVFKVSNLNWFGGK